MPARMVTVRAGLAVGWSLLAANGRPVARSVTTYPSDHDLVGALRELLAERHSLTFGLTRDRQLGWWWTAFLPPANGVQPGLRTTPAAPRPVARSGRGYLRQDQCRKGSLSFVSALEQIPADGGLGTLLVNDG